MISQGTATIRAKPLEFGANLCSVGKEDGRGQVASDATDDVDDGDPQPARQFLQIPQDGHLKRHRHQAVKDPGRMEKGLV